MPVLFHPHQAPLRTVLVVAQADVHVLDDARLPVRLAQRTGLSQARDQAVVVKAQDVVRSRFLDLFDDPVIVAVVAVIDVAGPALSLLFQTARSLPLPFVTVNSTGICRICCGMISGYNDEKPKPGPANLFKIIGKRIRMQGFIARDHQDLQVEFQNEMGAWVHDGRTVWEEAVTEGIENAPKAFLDLFEGNKMGKALVKVSGLALHG